jgi:hypothetical protein
MRISDIKELYNVTPIKNIPSIMEHGIVCYNTAKKMLHASIAMDEVQERRDKIKIHQGNAVRMLHDYTNLYFDAHNPMLCKLNNQNNVICILCINPKILLIENVIISDRNAACNITKFYDVVTAMKELDFEKIFADFWVNYDNEYDKLNHKAIKCAEILVPGKIEYENIFKAIVCNKIAQDNLLKMNFTLPIEINQNIFF